MSASGPRGKKDRTGRILSLAILAFYLMLMWLRFADVDFIDFPSFWLAAELAFGEDASPYGDSFAEGAERLVPGYVHPFIYPPAALLPLWPLSLVGLESGGRLLLALNVALAVLCGILSIKIATREEGRASAHPLAACVVMLLFMGAQSTRITLGHGQLNLVVLATALGSWMLLDQGRQRALAAGALLAIGITLKLYAVGLLAPLVLCQRWWALAGVGVGFGVAVTSAALALPGGLWADWFEIFVAAGDSTTFAGRFDLSSDANISLTGALLRLNATFGGSANELIAFLRFLLPMSLIASTLIASWWRGKAPATLAEVGAYLALIALVPANSWVHYAVFSLPGAAAVFLVACRRRALRLAILASGTIIVLLQNPLPVFVDILGLPKDAASFFLTGVLLLVWSLTIYVMRTEPSERPRLP